MLLIFKGLESCLSFFPYYIPPLAKGGEGDFLEMKSFIKSPLPLVPKRG
jgi:hypothetical protein